LLGQKRVKWWAADLTTPCPTHLTILRFGWDLPTSRGRSRPDGRAWRVPNRIWARVMARSLARVGIGGAGVVLLLLQGSPRRTRAAAGAVTPVSYCWQ
jgi:hypothetical protein